MLKVPWTTLHSVQLYWSENIVLNWSLVKVGDTDQREKENYMILSLSIGKQYRHIFCLLQYLGTPTLWENWGVKLEPVVVIWQKARSLARGKAIT